MYTLSQVVFRNLATANRVDCRIKKTVFRLLLRQQNDLDVVFKVNLDYEVLLLFDEDTTSDWPVIVDASSVMHSGALHLVTDLC